MTRISLCLVARDCESSLERCLASAAPHVDEICVVDLGSRDQTRAVAERHEALVISHRWDGDGAAALESATALCAGDWILILDPDEVLSGDDPRAELEAYIEHNAGALGCLAEGARKSSAADFVLPANRCLPADLWPRFEGRSEPSVSGEAPEAQLALEITRPYALRALPATGAVDCLGESASALLDEDEDEASPSCESWYGLGMSLRLQGRHEQALDAFSEALERATSDTEFVPHLFECTSYCMRTLGRSDEALALMDQIEGAFLERADTIFAIALLCLDTQQFERAELGFQRCLQLHGVEVGGGPSEEGRTSFAAHHNLGVLREMLEMNDEALEQYEQALAIRPGYLPSLEGRARMGALLETSKRCS